MILGLHHVTATVGTAQPDLDFYVGVLGLRLVKKTVNFDNTQVYHLYYGNEVGMPGTLMTTFPYGGWGIPSGRHGHGQVRETRFAVPPGTASWWSDRLTDKGLSPEAATTAFGETAIAVSDPSGLDIRLVEAADDRESWTDGGVSREHAITGIHSVAFPVTSAEPSVAFLEGVLGWTHGGTSEGTTRMLAGEGGAGRVIDVVAEPEGEAGVNGLGTVHHVAMAVEDDATQLAYRDTLVRAGVPVTEVKDRQYFQSIYFREPGGILYEIATLPPGFAVDEEVSELGRALKLPPWEETHRDRIEEGLAPLEY